MTARAIPFINDQGRAAEAFPHRVLLAPPTTRTIPIFSLQGEVGRPANEVWSVSQKDERAVIDKQALGRLRAVAFGDHRFITTRHKEGLREARYAIWLAFCEEGHADAFQAEFPRYGLTNLLAGAQRRIATIEHDLQQGLSRGRFNLRVIDENARYGRAKLYVSYQDEIVSLRRAISNLQRVGGGDLPATSCHLLIG